MPRHYILVPFGSSGDVNPFLWIAKCLGAAGHEVTLLLTPPFADAARNLNIGTSIVGEPGQYETVLENPDLWHPWRAGRIVMRYAAEGIGVYFDAIRAAVERSSLETVLIGGSLAFGARLAREKFRLPLVSVHLQPSVFMSIHDTPVPFAGWEWLIRMPAWFKRFLFSLPNPIDRAVRPAARAMCIREGVTPPKRFWPDWFHSPDLVLGLFPDWFAPPQPDWPAHHRLIGFPLHDLSDQHDLPEDLEAFLAAGPPPVLATPGSAMAHGRRFFETTLAACTQPGLRLVLVSPFRDQIPSFDPAQAFHIDRIPFSLVLPRVDAFVHHGGIGTMSQGFAAGKPQLIMPMAHDQPDNANRLVRLGCGAMLYPKSYTPARVARNVRRLVGDRSIAERCHHHKHLTTLERPAERLVESLLSLADRKLRQP